MKDKLQRVDERPQVAKRCLRENRERCISHSKCLDGSRNGFGDLTQCRLFLIGLLLWHSDSLLEPRRNLQRAVESLQKISVVVRNLYAVDLSIHKRVAVVDLQVQRLAIKV